MRSWLERHHDDAPELWVGFHRKDSGLPSISWPEAVDEALCFGWIDGVRKRIDDSSYAVRFTRRRPTSTWSAVNVRRIEELIREGRVRPAGMSAFDRRSVERTAIYSYEREHAALERDQVERFRANRRAWEFFERQSPSYRRAAIWWVVSAKREDTRARRLETLIADSAGGRTIPQLTRP